ncbi:MAG TPA: DNA methyltransferase [Ktedonobacteraceae bacterium]
MATNRQQIQHYIQDFNFKQLFVNELGWDHLNEPLLAIPFDGQNYILRPLVEKRGVKVYVCDPDAQGNIPADPILRKVEREVTRHAYEHFIIYVDAAKHRQVWQWVKREQGKPLAPRLNRYYKGQSGELLAQKLEALAVSIDEEDKLHMAEVAGRVAKAFDVERVTRKFYDRFKLEHATFLDFIQGIDSQADREWYASLMLNRLMFIYFIQRKGFLDTKSPGMLDGDANYLSNRLKWLQEQRGEDQFHTFYRYFLLKLFHDGLSKHEHSQELEALLGKVPYLNGGLFDVHMLERDYPEMSIPDEAFHQLFDFFDDYDWHLDDRPLRNDKEINPDILGYIFEKYINQKQMGTYYTKEDITEYISKNTIIPYIFEAAEQKCMIAFKPDGPVWSLLRENSDRYIYDAVKKGSDLSLPPEIVAGVEDVAQRGEWNKSASEEYALPTEIWREVVARRTRYNEVRMKLADGEITSINDFITYNLDIRQFAQDGITYCEGTDLLRAFYDSIESVTVLDPTCGSGAFLFAALNILETLYEACLDRMQIIIEERDQLDAALPANKRQQHPALDHFRKILREVDRHPSRTYFIYKSIIINNLYGVDIMEEATEICKLRLFLKLVSQVDKFDDIEPLPDIDFNIRVGNTLVGFASYEETKKAIEGKATGKGTTRDEVAFQNQMIFDDRLDRIEQKAQEIERAFDHFRKLQTQLQLEAMDIAENKQHIRQKLDVLRAELDSYLASEYGIDRNNITKTEAYNEKFAQWQRSHQPFHWWIEFYGIMKRGGFDVVIGNPPYVEYEKVIATYTVRNYKTVETGNLYALTLERCRTLIAINGRFGMIVPASATCTDGYLPLQQILLQQSALYISSFSDQRGKLFDIPHPRLCIILYEKSFHPRNVFTTSYIKLGMELRDKLFQRLEYTGVTNQVRPGVIPRYGTIVEQTLDVKLFSQGHFLGDYVSRSGSSKLYYTRKLSWFVQVTPFIPKILDENGKLRDPSELKVLLFTSSTYADIAFVALNSNLFYWFLTIGSDCRNLNMREVLGFPINLENMATPIQEKLRNLAIELAENLQANSEYRNMSFKGIGSLTIQCMLPIRSKPVIEKIDRVLAKHYGFTDEELDFIINYDIKYRMGRDNGDESEE